jgi:hypothetical protein
LRVTSVGANPARVAVDVGRAVIAGFFYRTDVPVEISLPTNAVNPRIDRIVLRVNRSANTITPTYIQGTSLASPTAPTLVYDEGLGIFDLPLATVRVEATNTISTVTDTRRFLGRETVTCSSTNRPDPNGRPLLAYEVDTRRVISHSGQPGAVWNVGLAEDIYRVKVAASQDGGSTTATSWSSTLAGTAQPTLSLTFTAPLSGKVFARINCHIRNSSNTVSQTTLRIVESGGAIAVADGILRLELDTGTGTAAASCSSGLLFDLTPNTTYTATMRHQVSDGTGVFDERVIEIWPQP